MEALFTFDNLIKFISLSGLEIILGIDNIIFIAIISSNITSARRNKVRFFGISFAILLRIIMLTGASWVMTLNKSIINLRGMNFTGRELLLLLGGLFLTVKSVNELLPMLAAKKASTQTSSKKTAYSNELSVIYQIIFIDLVLSFDSIIVAVGMVNKLALIIPAILISMVVMLLSAQIIGDFINSNPTIKILGIGFVLLIGIFLTLDGLNIHLHKSYIYSSMFFALFIELMNIRIRKISGKP